LDCPMTLQSSRSLDTLSDLKLQRLEAELEGARHEAQGACQREEELKAECDRLREELGELQSNQRQREVSSTCGQCDVEWIKKAGDEQVNLALAYTELTEELGKFQALTSKQTEILRKVSQEPASPGMRTRARIPQLWMETEEEGDVRSCPLCQLIFPVGYPDDALIKHIDSHLENSKI
ncbi:hypothetical protein cypCar_00023562, partial [Cyprinus carpio]